jgi:hypothetical protein
MSLDILYYSLNKKILKVSYFYCYVKAWYGPKVYGRYKGGNRWLYIYIYCLNCKAQIEL